MTSNELNMETISLKDAIVSLRNDVSNLKNEYHDAQVTEKFLIELSNSLITKQYTKILNEWGKKRNIITQYLHQSDVADFGVEAIIQKLMQQRSADMQDFVERFPVAAKFQGIQIDLNSRHPNYYLMDGFIHVCVNEKKFEIIITPRMGKDIVVGPELETLIGILGSEIKRIFERDWDISSFRKNLAEIYKSAAPRNLQSQNSEVPIKLIMKEFKNRYQLSHDEFLVDFSRLLKEDKGIQLGNTRDSANGIQIIGSESNGYYGYMRIEELK